MADLARGNTATMLKSWDGLVCLMLRFTTWGGHSTQKATPRILSDAGYTPRQPEAAMSGWVQDIVDFFPQLTKVKYKVPGQP